MQQEICELRQMCGGDTKQGADDDVSTTHKSPIFPLSDTFFYIYLNTA